MMSRRTTVMLCLVLLGLVASLRLGCGRERGYLLLQIWEESGAAAGPPVDGLLYSPATGTLAVPPPPAGTRVLVIHEVTRAGLPLHAAWTALDGKGRVDLLAGPGGTRLVETVLTVRRLSRGRLRLAYGPDLFTLGPGDSWSQGRVLDGAVTAYPEGAACEAALDSALAKGLPYTVLRLYNHGYRP